MTARKLILRFPEETIDQPIIYKLVKDYDLLFNILNAKITPKEEGVLVIELSGDKDKYDKAVEYLKRLGVSVEPLEKDIKWDDILCTNCTACISHCPTGALFIKDRKTMEVAFDKEKCILCEACVKVCPYNAVRIDF